MRFGLRFFVHRLLAASVADYGAGLVTIFASDLRQQQPQHLGQLMQYKLAWHSTVWRRLKRFTRMRIKRVGSSHVCVQSWEAGLAAP